MAPPLAKALVRRIKLLLEGFDVKLIVALRHAQHLSASTIAADPLVGQGTASQPLTAPSATSYEPAFTV